MSNEHRELNLTVTAQLGLALRKGQTDGDGKRNEITFVNSHLCPAGFADRLTFSPSIAVLSIEGE